MKPCWSCTEITVVTDTRDVLSVWNFDGKLVFEDITRVTENFTRISIFSDGAKTHGKIRIPSEKYFSDGVPSEKYPRKYNDRKF